VRGDFFLCASEEQRHLWLGQLAAFGRVSPENYDRTRLCAHCSRCARRYAGHPPVQMRHAIRARFPAIGPEDKVILWAGGVYNWFDR